MDEKEILEVVHIEKKLVKNGTMTIFNITDGRSRRVGSTFKEDWVKDWKLGDKVEVIWKKGTVYKGTQQWSIHDPNEKPRSGRNQFGGGQSRGFPTTPMIVYAYQLAASLGKVLLPAKSSLDDYDKLARSILENLNKGLPPIAPEKKEPEKVEVRPEKPAVEEEGFGEEDDTF